MSGSQLVVGYDGSVSSQHALTWALREAQVRALPVLVVYVGYTTADRLNGFVTYIDPNEDSSAIAGNEILVEALQRSHTEQPGVEVETRYFVGHPASVLVDLLDNLQNDAAMVVLGSRGRSSFTELLVGSTSIQVAAHAPCPVVVVRPPTGKPGPDEGRVVLGVDGSAVSENAVELAFEEASRRQVGLTAIHAWDAPFFDVRGRAAAIPERVLVEEFAGDEMRALAEGLAGWSEKYPDVDVQRVLVHGEATTALVEASAGAELLVVGSRGRGGFRSLALGSVSHAVLHHARCPVAVVAASRHGGERR